MSLTSIFLVGWCHLVILLIWLMADPEKFRVVPPNRIMQSKTRINCNVFLYPQDIVG